MTATPASQLDELFATVFDKVKPVLADQITSTNPLLAALNAKAKVTEDGGKRIVRPVLFAFNDTVGSYSGYDLIDTTPQDGFGEAIYDWKQYAGSVTIDGKTERLNAGSAQIIPILQAKIDQLRLSFEEDMNAMLWNNGTASATGNSGKDFLSVTHIVGDGATIGHLNLGGIESAVQTWWKSGIQVGCDLTTLDGVRTMNSVRNGRKLAMSKPDLLFAPQNVYEAYEALATPNIRFEDLTMANLGFDSVQFHAAEVVFEDDVPANSIYFLNTEFLEFVQHADAWLSAGPFKSPVNQDAKTSLVISMGELITNCRRAHAVITSVTSA